MLHENTASSDIFDEFFYQCENKFRSSSFLFWLALSFLPLLAIQSLLLNNLRPKPLVSLSRASKPRPSCPHGRWVWIGLDKESGTIENAKRGDLILVNGNPLDDIHNIRNVEYVITGGTMYHTAELWQSVGFKP